MNGTRAGWRRQARQKRLVRFVLLGIVVLVTTAPLAWTVLASVGLHPDNAASPPAWSVTPSLERYAEVGIAEEGFWGEIAASLSTSAVSTLVTMVIAFLAAYGILHSGVRRKKRRMQGFLILASLPIMAYAIPLEGTVRALRLHDTFGGLVAAQAAILAPLAVYVLFGFLSQGALEFEEAARLDGASLGMTLARVILPMHTPGVAATAIIVFILNWNAFLAPMVLTTHHLRTIPLAMSDFFTVDRELDWPSAAAALTVSFLPLAVLVAVSFRTLQRFFLGAADSAG